jgi:hypothetical protein
MTWNKLIAGLAAPAAIVAPPQSVPRSQLQNMMDKLEAHFDPGAVDEAGAAPRRAQAAGRNKEEKGLI